MSSKVAVLVGTRKGAFIMESNAERKDWSVRGPYLEGQNVMHMAYDYRTGNTLAAVGDPWFGSRVYCSTDMGHTWNEPQSGPAFPADSGLTLNKIWCVEPGRSEEPGVIYAGVEPAALFKSSDYGQTWEWVQGLNEHPTRPQWAPGAGGLCLHSLVLDPSNLERIYIGISSVGVFRTSDGGSTWETANKGTRANFMPEQEPVYPEWGQCVHHVTMHPSIPERLYQQNHCGVYRSDNGADSWNEITEGLPSDWGFVISVHGHDPDTIWVCPGTNGYKHWVPDARLRVYRSRDQGAHWDTLTEGLPQENAWVNLFRQAMSVDGFERAGVYFGTNTGQLYSSADEGDTWRQSGTLFPPINSVGTATL